MEIACGQMAWLIYILSAYLNGRVGSKNEEESDQCDGVVASTVFQVMEVHEKWLCSTNVKPKYGQVQIILT